MGRAKLSLELIQKSKARIAAFHMRRNTLKKKVHELATLCDIKVMMIINGPNQDIQQTCPLEPEIFPDNRDEVLELINAYKGQSVEDHKNKTNLLSDVFEDMIKKARKDLTKLRITNLRSKYPTWDSRLSSFTENDLRTVAANLENNIENAKAKVGQLKANYSNNIDCANLQLQQQRMLTKKRNMDFEVGNHANKYRVTLDPHQAGSMRVPVPMPIQQERFPVMDHYQDQSMVNFGYDYVGGASNIVYNPPPFQALYDCPTMAGTMDSIPYINNLVMEPPNYYSEARQPTAQHIMKYHPMRPGSAPHQMVMTSHQPDAHDQISEDLSW
ncbi:MADS-box domain-containing protein [Heracleum sosnowskyi]|uniref:MADS-box domain-containing protein n=1 Tax=Heracleum sosnowskyi TaxID=360622 RepID=A0AAD8H287_9APIA|nr:MADS-box domain-containing protein [Heracleum sosnowskyi]